MKEANLAHPPFTGLAPCALGFPPQPQPSTARLALANTPAHPRYPLLILYPPRHRQRHTFQGRNSSTVTDDDNELRDNADPPPRGRAWCRNGNPLGDGKDPSYTNENGGQDEDGEGTDNRGSNDREGNDNDSEDECHDQDCEHEGEESEEEKENSEDQDPKEKSRGRAREWDGSRGGPPRPPR